MEDRINFVNQIKNAQYGPLQGVKKTFNPQIVTFYNKIDSLVDKLLSDSPSQDNISSITPALYVSGGHVWCLISEDPSDKNNVIAFDCAPNGCKISSIKVIQRTKNKEYKEAIDLFNNKNITTTLDYYTLANINRNVKRFHDYESFPGGKRGRTAWITPNLNVKERTILKYILLVLAFKTVLYNTLNFDYPGSSEYLRSFVKTTETVREQYPGITALTGECYKDNETYYSLKTIYNYLNFIITKSCPKIESEVCSTSSVLLFKTALVLMSTTHATSFMGPAMDSKECNVSDVFFLGYINKGKWRYVTDRFLIVEDDDMDTGYSSYGETSADLFKSNDGSFSTNLLRLEYTTPDGKPTPLNYVPLTDFRYQLDKIRKLMKKIFVINNNLDYFNQINKDFDEISGPFPIRVSEFAIEREINQLIKTKEKDITFAEIMTDTNGDIEEINDAREDATFEKDRQTMKLKDQYVDFDKASESLKNYISKIDDLTFNFLNPDSLSDSQIPQGAGVALDLFNKVINDLEDPRRGLFY
jgi:hypothetical protein